MRPIMKERALGVIAGNRELHAFTRRQDAIERVRMPGQKRTGLEPIPGMCRYERFHGQSTVADDNGEVFVRDREDSAPRFSRESVVEDPRLTRAWVIRLHQN